ncbi:unnamed protein product [Alopecurus aequalis]
MTRRCGILSSPPLAAIALLLLLGFSHCAAAARLLPATTAPRQGSIVPLPPPPIPSSPVLHTPDLRSCIFADIGVTNVKAADAASDKLVALHTEGGKVGNGEEAVWEAMTAAEEGEEEACGEGNDGEECMQRRMLHDAHLDYIYTQHKGRP